MILPGNDPTTQPSFSLGNRVARAAWGVAWLLLFRPSPRVAHAWRRALLRLFGARIGAHVHVYPGARTWAPATKSTPAPTDTKPQPATRARARAARISCLGAPRASRHSLAPDAAT